MYPTLSEFLKSLGINLPLPIQTFGFFVALSFLAAAITLSRELKRKATQGMIPDQSKKVIVGKPASMVEYITNIGIGFVIGYKLSLLLTDYMAFVANPQDILLSADGNFWGGFIGALLLFFLKLREDKSQRLEKPIEKTIRIKPEDHLSNLIVLAVVGGLLGAKIFHNLENLNELVRNPIGSLLSFSGLTFYGGLIVAAILIIRYARKNGIVTLVLSDAIVPGLMLAYGIGRIGCHVSGDGDWGIINSAYISAPDGKVSTASKNDFSDTANAYLRYYQFSFEGVKTIQKAEDIPHSNVKAPTFLPDWTVAYSFPRNVNNEGVPLFQMIEGRWEPYTQGRWDRRLPIPVFPTSLYEAFSGIILFFFLWGLRKKIRTTGIITCIYMIANGIERFTIEKIRVNTEYKIFELGVSQAEIISFLFIISGSTLLFILIRKKTNKPVKN